MKLLHKTTLYLLLAVLPIALGGTYLLNAYIHQYMLREIDELLLSELVQVKEQLRRHPPAPASLPGWNPNVRVDLTSASLQPTTYSNSVAYDPWEKEQIPVRRLQASYVVAGRHYRVVLQQSYLELDEIAGALSVGVIICFLLVVFILLLANVLVSRHVWRPFYSTIHQLQRYRIDEPDETLFPGSDVHEFSLLSQSLDTMSRRTRYQYTQQKQFTDNASHEMQTPLSVLSCELELLLQSEQLSEIDMNRIQRAQQEVKRLSALNQSLLLLARIDNLQFAQHEPINLGALITQLLADYSDYAAHKGITIIRSLIKEPYRNLNPQLARVLFANLLKNAFRHGDPNRPVWVHVGNTVFIISNEGDPLPFPENQLFDRFVRNQAVPGSTGLGLALVKEIAGQYGMNVQYTYIALAHRHTFQLDF